MMMPKFLLLAYILVKFKWTEGSENSNNFTVHDIIMEVQITITLQSGAKICRGFDGQKSRCQQASMSKIVAIKIFSKIKKAQNFSGKVHNKELQTYPTFQVR